jgi:hypothetical protein
VKLWIDDLRPAPEGHLSFRTVNDALRYIRLNSDFIELIDLDHDAGDCAKEGGDYINILKEMQRLTRSPIHKLDFSHIKFRLHSMNPVGVQNMRYILQDNGWKEVK